LTTGHTVFPGSTYAKLVKHYAIIGIEIEGSEPQGREARNATRRYGSYIGCARIAKRRIDPQREAVVVIAGTRYALEQPAHYKECSRVRAGADVCRVDFASLIYSGEEVFGTGAIPSIGFYAYVWDSLMGACSYIIEPKPKEVIVIHRADEPYQEADEYFIAALSGGQRAEGYVVVVAGNLKRRAAAINDAAAGHCVGEIDRYDFRVSGLPAPRPSPSDAAILPYQLSDGIIERLACYRNPRGWALVICDQSYQYKYSKS
jgi:hypothetical protein